MIVNLLTEDNLPSYHREIAESSAATAPGASGSTAGPPRRAGTPSRCATTCWSPRRSIPSSSNASGWSTCPQGYDSGDKSHAPGRWRTSPSRSSRPASPTATPAGDRRPDVRAAAHPHRHRREPAHDLLPEPGRRRARDRPEQPWWPSCEVVDFQMPGTRIPGFARKAVKIAKAGIYDLRPASGRRRAARPALLAGVRTR